MPAASFLSYPAGRPNAAKPPTAPSVSWPATTQRHTNHTTARARLLYRSSSSHRCATSFSALAVTRLNVPASSSALLHARLTPPVDLTRPNVPPLHPLLPRPLLLPPGRLLHPPPAVSFTPHSTPAPVPSSRTPPPAVARLNPPTCWPATVHLYRLHQPPLALAAVLQAVAWSDRLGYGVGPLLGLASSGGVGCEACRLLACRRFSQGGLRAAGGQTGLGAGCLIGRGVVGHS